MRHQVAGRRRKSLSESRRFFCMVQPDLLQGLVVVPIFGGYLLCRHCPDTLSQTSRKSNVKVRGNSSL